MQDLKDTLRQCFEGRVCLMGIGNVDYSDDGFGVVLAEKIEERFRARESGDRHEVINAGTVPERFIEPVVEKDFDHFIFFDAVDVGAEGGSVVFLDAEEIMSLYPQFSTHKISLGLIAKLIGRNGRTKTWLLGVQPGSVGIGQGFTEEVKGTLNILEDVLWELLHAAPPAPPYHKRMDQECLI